MQAVGDGRFSQTSRDIRLEEGGRFLAATCRTSAGEWVPSRLDLYFYLANIDGVLKFALQRPGRFLITSDNVTLTGATLRGSARRTNQTSVPFELDLDHNVANIEGRLLWLVNPAKPYDAPDNDEAGFGTYNVSDDPEMANYAKSLESHRPKREITITPPTQDDRKDIQNLVRLWDLDIMDRNLGQIRPILEKRRKKQGCCSWSMQQRIRRQPCVIESTTMVEFPRRPQPNEYTPRRQGWRIDNQENGSFPRNNLQYYSLAVQNGSAVYASVLVPVRYRVGRTRIRNAFLQSMEQGQVVTIDPPPPGQRQPPAQDDPRAEQAFVQSLAWVVLIGLIVLC